MDEHADDPRLAQAFDLIRQVLADTEKRVRDQVAAEIRDMIVKKAAPFPVGEGNMPARVARGEYPISPAGERPIPKKRKRARTGLVREVVMRELADAPAGGFTPSEIANRVRTDEERAISASSFRSELRAGHDIGVYRSVEGGKWVLARAEEENEKAGSAVDSNPAFSLSEQEGR